MIVRAYCIRTDKRPPFWKVYHKTCDERVVNDSYAIITSKLNPENNELDAWVISIVPNFKEFDFILLKIN